MITYILPGFSASNKDWALETAKKLDLDHEVRPVFWSHWEDPEKTLNPKKKAQDLIDVLLHDRANIIAKSVGTLVASYMIKEIPDRIEKVVLCGIPSTSKKKLEILKESLNNFPPEKILVIQNTNDPLASYYEVKTFMQKINPKIQVVEKARQDHNYPYKDDFEKFLK